MKFSIEKMTAERIPEVVRLEKEAFSRPWSENSLISALNDENSRFLVALVNGSLAGYIGVYETPGEAFVANLAVFSEFRRNGIGRALLRAACDGAKERGREFITLEVRESGVAAVSLYESAGFQKVGIRKNIYSAPTENGAVYVKRFYREAKE